MIAGIGLVAITTLGPFIMRGSVFNAVRAVAMLTRQEGVSDNAANLWWIFTWLARAVSYAPDIGWLTALTKPVRMVSIARVVAEGFPSPRVVGTTIVVAAWAWAVWRASRSVSLADILACAGWSGFVYFLFAAQVHENHLYLAVILFGLAAALDDRFRWVFWGLSASNGLNLVLFYGIGREFPKLSRAAWGFDVSLLLVAANLVLFAATTRIFLQTRMTPAPKTAPAYL